MLPGESFQAYRLASTARKQKVGEREQRQENDRLERDRAARQEEWQHARWSEISEKYRDARGYDMRAIANDPDLDELGKQRARGMIERLGYFTQTGL